MLDERVASEMQAALTAAEDESATPSERAEMLTEMAMGLQRRPKSTEQLDAAIELYDRALAICPRDEALSRARISARRATALQARPEEGTASLEAARGALAEAIPVLAALAAADELAEAEMNLGVVLHTLAGVGRARLADAVSAYQRALRTFDRDRHAPEFAILQNNLATAFLAMPLDGERVGLREAMAVEAFEAGLKAVNIVDHPTEYAMLQNNLGNALQYAASSHSVANNLRALEAYDEALKVRGRDNAPLEYANTLANRANCLCNLPDDPAHPERGGRANLFSARAAYAEAQAIFSTYGELERARLVAEALEEIGRGLPDPAATDDEVLRAT